MWFLLLLPTCLALHSLEPPPPAPASRNTPVQGYVDVRLNHFDASNTDTFPMRYYYNGEFATGSDIVIFVGGEWSISAGWVQAGLAYELAQELKAGLFYSEHRYYGQTRPTDGTSVSELRFLTVDQALADLAQFIQHVKGPSFQNGQFRLRSEIVKNECLSDVALASRDIDSAPIDIFDSGSVALVGCSYSGSMATWMRLAYPHLVQAAFSDSGPLHAQEDFPEYLEVITEALRVQGGEECLASVEQAIEQLVELLATSNGPAQASQMFNTCTPLQVTSPLDVATFFWFGITESFAYLVQYALPGNIPAACAVLNNPDVASPMQRLANWITSQTQPCIETRYAEVVASHTNTSYDAPDAVMRLWTYQTCVEFGWYQTTTSSNQPFLSSVPLEYFHQMCKDFFSTYFDEARLRSGIERTNLLFAGLTHIPDGVVSVAGAHDPWSPMGPNANHATPGAPVYVVSQSSHCRAVQPTSSSETEEIAATKMAVLNYMYESMTGWPLFISGSTRTLASSLVVLAAVVVLLG